MSARSRLLISLVLGVAVGVLVSIPGNWRYGVLIGYIAAAGIFVAGMWRSIWPMDPAATERHATTENPGRGATEATMIGASLASLLAVGLLLTAGSGNKSIQAGLSVVAVAVAWLSVHTVFATRYARLYYVGNGGGIDFNQDDPPQYSDFAYLAFTIGMTFQVSDTDLKTRLIRSTALRHMLLSWVFGAIIIAATINLIAGLSK